MLHRFTHQSFDAIPPHGIADFFPSDETKAAFGRIVRARTHYHKRMRPGFALVPHVLKIVAAQTVRAVHKNPKTRRACVQSLRVWKLLLLQARAGRRHAKLLAPFGAARGNHFASAFGLHTIAETVRALSLEAFGLIRSFHLDSLILER